MKVTQSRGTSGLGRTVAAKVIQAMNFFLNDIPRFHHPTPAVSFEALFKNSARTAFNPKHPFITTGPPHSHAIYLRNYAWFYPFLLDPSTFTGVDDANHRVDLLVRGLELILRNGSQAPYPTTFVPITPHR